MEGVTARASGALAVVIIILVFGHLICGPARRKKSPRPLYIVYE